MTERYNAMGPKHEDFETEFPDWHYLPSDDFHWQCVWGQDCATAHANECENRPTEVADAVRSNDPRKILDALAFTDRYFINWERIAIQGNACTGEEVVRHIPISDELLSAATGLSVSFCKVVRKGGTVPHPRQWDAFRAAIGKAKG